MCFTKSVEADNATMVTSNARIDGKFRVSRELELRTSNQAIDAQVTLDHDVSRSDTVSSNLTMVTTNAYVPAMHFPLLYTLTSRLTDFLFM